MDKPLYEAINWARVADCLEQRHDSYLSQVLEASDDRAKQAGTVIAAVLGSLVDAIREGLS